MRDVLEVHSKDYLDPNPTPQRGKSIWPYVMAAGVGLSLAIACALVRPAYAEEPTEELTIEIGKLARMGNTVLCNRAEQLANILKADQENPMLGQMTLRQYYQTIEESPDGNLESACAYGSFTILVGEAVDTYDVRGVTYFIVEAGNPRTGTMYYVISRYAPVRTAAEDDGA